MGEGKGGGRVRWEREGGGGVYSGEGTGRGLFTCVITGCVEIIDTGRCYSHILTIP